MIVLEIVLSTNTMNVKPQLTAGCHATAPGMIARRFAQDPLIDFRSYSLRGDPEECLFDDGQIAMSDPCQLRETLLNVGIWNGLDLSRLDLEFKALTNEIKIHLRSGVWSYDRHPMSSLRLGYRCDDRELWIYELTVAESLRGRGLGSKIVQRTEALAIQIFATKLLAFPLATARSFWLSHDFVPHPRTTNLLYKYL